ncbi:MAG: molybdopterin-dependent oxidoreductase [Desulfobacterales bacterium]|nr:molybdopterin-dependent oxidoreductase [Desulfobacterales bacterium]
MTLKVVGQNVLRYDGLAHVTGETHFADDVIIPGTLTVKVLRSPVSKGKIMNLDIRAAMSVPGVASVITADDVPCNGYGHIPDQPVLVEEMVRYKGEPIVAVAAVDEDTAIEALEKIQLGIEEEEPVFDHIQAMMPDAPKVRPEGNIHMFGKYPFRQVKFGDIDAGFREADVIIENTYRHPSLEHAQLEPMVSQAVPEAGGKLTVYTVSQAPHFHLEELYGILKVKKNNVSGKHWITEKGSRTGQGLEFGDINFIGGTVGGGFGGKNDMHADHITALLALKSGQPCKWRWTREEDLLYSTYRGCWYITIKDGVKKDGRIVARKIKTIRESGAYASSNPHVVEHNIFNSTGPYFIPNVHSRGYCVYTNKPPASSMRGFGLTPSTFATEVQANKIASELSMDPWEFRFKNVYRNGDLTSTGSKLDSVALIEMMQTLAEKTGVTLPDRLKQMSSAKRGGNSI